MAAEDQAVAEVDLTNAPPSSYKCEDCGKIIAVPAEMPAPRCCGQHMTRIR